MIFAPLRSNRFDCPFSICTCRFCPYAIAASTLPKISARLPWRESNAPAWTSPSIVFLFARRRSTRAQKSKISLNRPFSVRAFTICSTAPVPTFFIALNPKRIPVGVTTKLTSLSLTSGGITLIPNLRHSSMSTTILSVSFISLDNVAAIYSAG